MQFPFPTRFPQTHLAYVYILYTVYKPGETCVCVLKLRGAGAVTLLAGAQLPKLPLSSIPLSHSTSVTPFAPLPALAHASLPFPERALDC